MNSKIVLGLSYGDEGKGSITSFLSSLSKNPLVVRFNGGHQAGHTVVYKGRKHKFSTFGSGTLQGVPTFWSKYCTFYPVAVANEYEDLKDLKPILFVDPLCPVTTPFDIMIAQGYEKRVKHGSCGVGFGQTIKRHEEHHYKLFVQDLFYPKIFEEKLNNIIKFYDFSLLDKKILQVKETFFNYIEEIKSFIKIGCPDFYHYSDIIFEGAQGILLDMDFGFFPHVTRSNTTSKNALKIIKEFELPDPEVYYVSRCYQTRHGNGFLSNEEIKIDLKNLHTETNQLDDWQGYFRRSILDLDMMRYALQSDSYYSKEMSKNLVITCLDQLDENNIPFTINNEQKTGNIKSIFQYLKQFNFTGIYSSSNIESTSIKRCAVHVADSAGQRMFFNF